MFDVPLEAAPVSEVIVTGARLPPSAGEGAFAITALADPVWARSTRLDEQLSRSPGVSLFRRTSSLAANPTTQGLSLRAIAPSGAGRALVTLDGVPQNDPFGGWVIWSGLPSETIQDVRIVRGAGAQAYGAGALTGVVALTGRDGGAPVLEAGVEAGSLGYRRAAVTAGQGGFLASVSGERSGGWTPVREGRGAADEALAMQTWTAALRYDARLTSGPAMAARLAVYDENRRSGLVGADARTRGAQASLTLAQAPSEGRKGWRLQAWSLVSDLQNRSVAVATGRVSTTPANDQYETPAYGLGFNAALRGVRGLVEWELGADVRAAEGETHERFRYMSGQFTRLREAGGRTTTAGVYADASWTQGAWLVTGDLRLDAWRAFDARRHETDAQTGAVTLDAHLAGRSTTTPTGRIGLRRDLGPGFLRAAAYAGFRPPSLNELHRPFRVGNDVTEANSALKPERLYGLEAGGGLEGGAGSLTATLFVNRLEDPVANVTIGQGPGTFPTAGFIPAGGVLRQRRNVGRIDAVGLELEGRANLSERWVLTGAVMATDAEVDGGADAPQLTGLRPAQAPRLAASAGLEWKASSRLDLFLAARHEGARFDDDLNTRRLPAATTLNLSARYVISRSTRLELDLRNAIDAEVATGRTGDGVTSYDAPRSLRLGLVYAR
ncbi:TonB-dependent receptor [Caulobacter hibisci]|uniref:TonB-dependent receptor n=1 Tax=Caulobacter hibisci TaxID=2035993 RepID=A0ABS0SVT5_9CAUL|nr:TonB-dependent receptor [Caulobacter hibisci]MBI1682747.1 TonB-dependent receptor [Caulobacter hibisci]